MLTFIISLLCVDSKLVELNEDNLITLRGTVNSDSVSKWIRDINLINDDDIYMYITSPGGSVLQGMAFIEQLNALKLSGKKINCIADFAASMAFVIFQSCSTRYVLDSSVLMQHQMALELGGNLINVENYLKFINDNDLKLTREQALRLNMTSIDFHNKVMNDWWITGDSALEHNLADEKINVKCSKDLFRKTETINIRTIFGEVTLEFYKCPIISNPVNVNIDSQYHKFIKYYIPDLAINELKKRNYVPNFD